MTTLKGLLELKESDDYERDFNALREQVLPMLNQLAKENAELKRTSEDQPLSETEWPQDLFLNPRS